MFYRIQVQENLPATIGLPLSFWIRNIEWNSETINQLCKHVSFYMRFYDSESPITVIVEELPEISTSTLPRYPYGEFPKRINVHSLDTQMLDLWYTAIEASDIIRRFLHSYQILEYYAHYYVDNKIMKELKALLFRPNAVSNVHEVTSKIIHAMIPRNEDDKMKLNRLLEECVEVDAVWQIINAYRDTFIKPIEFDGGFKMQEPLIDAKEDYGGFSKRWPGKFIDQLEILRNHIAHAREKHHSTRIAPTLSTQARLIPWADVLLCIVEQVMINSERH